MVLSSGEQAIWAAAYVQAREVRLAELTAKERCDHDKDYEEALFDATEDAWEVVFELREMAGRRRRTGKETADGGDPMIRAMLGEE